MDFSGGFGLDRRVCDNHQILIFTNRLIFRERFPMAELEFKHQIFRVFENCNLKNTLKPDFKNV